MAAGDITAKRSNYSDFPCNVFDGVDDYVEIPHAAQQLGANLSNGFTISAWINARTTGEGGAGKILDKGTDANGTTGFRFHVQSSTTISIKLNAGNTIISNADFSLKRWHHCLITITSAQLASIFINGTLSGAANRDLGQAVSTITTTNAIRIGNRSTGTDYTFDGSIRNVKIWNRVLTSTEITEEYNGKNNSDGLIHYFKLGGDYADYGSVGVTATNSGSIANNTLPNQLLTNTRQLNLAAATDKIIALPVMGRSNIYAIISANRAAA